MKNQSEIRNPKSEIAVVGAGPAGSSLAIRLAREGFKVTLVEREQFPRQKLCGEFVSPECLEHFHDLGVLDEMFEIGGDRINETVFYEPGGRAVSVASKWFSGGVQGALSISRAEMDLRLLQRAREAGADVLEETAVQDLLLGNGRVLGVKVKHKSGESSEIFADLTVDATGRARVLGRLAVKKISRESAKAQKSQIPNPKSQIAKNRLVGFKTHLRNVNLEKGVCEIYFFQGGYGGLSYIENGLANHCFLIEAETVRRFGGDAARIVEKVVLENKRAAWTLKDAVPVHEWLAVSVDGFGRKDLAPASGLLTVGDASMFIDPFTGSGMLLALESAEMLAETIAENRFAPANIEEIYKRRHLRKFQNRLRISSVIRRLANAPRLMDLAFSALSFSGKARRLLARSTRKTVPTNYG